MVNDVVGLVLGSEIPPERLGPLAAAAESGGFAHVWLSEDCFLTGGIAGAALALGATDRIPVGIGVVSAVTRHPAVLSMELATLARAYPGRLHPAIGLGVPDWLGAMGLGQRSPLRAVRECLHAVRALLAGEEVTRSGPPFDFSQVQLAYPPAERLPLHLGVAGPRMLQLSGSAADGTLLSVLAGVDYVQWARAQIDTGRAAADAVADTSDKQAAESSGGADPAAVSTRARSHQVTCFALCSVGDDGDAARQRARAATAFYLAAGGPNAITDAYGISEDLAEILQRGGRSELERVIPDRWVQDLTISGTAQDAIDQIERLRAAGADQVALYPVPADNAEHIVHTVSRDVIPNVSS